MILFNKGNMGKVVAKGSRKVDIINILPVLRKKIE